jgi:crotonobetainyl-CoA:carnitine CoA-transferase CaiB-like acyl-CoA transferase
MSGAHFYGAIVTALFERERTGRGRVVEVSMLEALFATLLPAAGHAYQATTRRPTRQSPRRRFLRAVRCFRDLGRRACLDRLRDRRPLAEADQGHGPA